MKEGDAVVIDALTQNKQRRRRYMTWTLVLLVALALVLPLIPYAVEYAQVGDSVVPNPGSDLWRDVRQRDNPVTGQTQVNGVDSGVLIYKGGEDWRVFRMQWLAPYGAIFIGTVLGLTILFYLVRGSVPIPGAARVNWFSVSLLINAWCTGLRSAFTCCWR